MINRIVYSLIILVIGLIILSCSDNEFIQSNKAKIINEFNFIVQDSLRLDNPSFWYDGQKIKDFFLILNKDEQRVELFSFKGKLLSFFGQKGYGPGEFQNITRLDTYKDEVYVIDKHKLTVTCLKIVQDDLIYVNEFKVSGQPVQLCVLNEDCILITFSYDVNNLKLYNTDGKLLKTYSIPYREKFKNTKESLISSYWIDNIDETKFVLGHIAQMYLYFCTFDPISESIEVIDEKKICYDRNITTIKLKNSNTFEISGLSPITHCRDKYYISLRSDNAQYSETFFEKYDPEGNYLGNTNIKGYKAVFKVISETEDILWFKTLYNYDYIYIAKKRNVDESSA